MLNNSKDEMAGLEVGMRLGPTRNANWGCFRTKSLQRARQSVWRAGGLAAWGNSVPHRYLADNPGSAGMNGARRMAGRGEAKAGAVDTNFPTSTQSQRHLHTARTASSPLSACLGGPSIMVSLVRRSTMYLRLEPRAGGGHGKEVSAVLMNELGVPGGGSRPDPNGERTLIVKQTKETTEPAPSSTLPSSLALARGTAM